MFCFRYEVSNFARGRENECQHSLKGWTGQDYWGIGPGACSRLTSNYYNFYYLLKHIYILA